MKRTPEQAATITAWLNMLDHCEAQLQAFGALPKSRVTLREAREQVATLSHNLETVIKANKARKSRAVANAHKSRETIAKQQRYIAGVERENERLRVDGKVAVQRAERLDQVTKHSEERRLELLALANELGCDCVPHKMLEAVRYLKRHTPLPPGSIVR